MKRVPVSWSQSKSLKYQGVAGVPPQVNLREHVTCMPPPSTNKAAHSGFETQETSSKVISPATLVARAGSVRE